MASDILTIKVFCIPHKPDPDDLGMEALKLALIPAVKFTDNDFRIITNPIRWGFEDSFAREGTPTERWQQLAKATLAEREHLVGTPGMVSGFTREHPILQRTGGYRQSWISAQHSHHKMEIIDFPLSGGYAGRVDINVGSKDPRVERLSTEGDDSPARPVHILSDGRLRELGRCITWTLESKIRGGL